MTGRASARRPTVSGVPELAQRQPTSDPGSRSVWVDPEEPAPSRSLIIDRVRPRQIQESGDLLLMPNVTEVQLVSSARVPTPTGEFQLRLYHHAKDGQDHLAVVMGAIAEAEGVLARLRSECFTGDVLHSLRCDCGEQFRRALEMIAAEGSGVLIYLRQEGRGIGLRDKLRAYNLQDAGLDTVDANLALGHQADERDYGAAAGILRHLGVRSVRLLTNNPHKIEALRGLGIEVVARLPLLIPATDESAAYLRTKRTRLNHWINLDSNPTPPGRPPTRDR